jgi:LPXTG-site transpeptidase (sortase) family protein
MENKHILPHPPKPPKQGISGRMIGIGLIALALGGVTPSFLPVAALESSYYINTIKQLVRQQKEAEKPLPASVPVRFNPLIAPDGSEITPIDPNFGIVIPKIGVNATVIPAVNPLKEADYGEALKEGVAHASTSFFPDEEGVVYLFSHSTNYEWFAKDLNAIFYLLKNLEAGDLIVLSYKGGLYTYRLTEKRVVKPSEISYLQPISGERKLILQTCWPPGSTAERLLLIAELIDRQE